MKIILIGFMGVGKTTVAQVLAQKLSWKVIGTDELITTQENVSSVKEIFESKGEAHFRAQESALCAELKNEHNCIISTGGGIVQNPVNIPSLRNVGDKVIFLESTFEEIAQRLAHDQSRPLFQDKQKALTLFQRRQELYLKASDLRVSTLNKTPEEIADEILSNNTDQKTCYVIGSPIAHSLSPWLHTQAFTALSLTHKYSFKSLLVEPAQLGEVIAAVRQQGIHFLAVTLPHKEAILPLLDVLDDSAKNAGAVNSVINHAGKLHGYNTDVLGILNPLLSRRPLANAHIAIIGAGGAARAALSALAQASTEESPISVTVFNRSVNKAEKLANSFHSKTLKSQALPLTALDLSNINIVIQASAVGLAPNVEVSPIPSTALHKDLLIFETIYAPKHTKLIQEAQQIGCQTILGAEMFAHQAAAQIKLYTGKKIQPERLLELLGNS